MTFKLVKNSNVDWIGLIPTTWEVRRVKHGFYRKDAKANQENPVVLSLARSGVKVRDITNNEGQLAESYTDYNPVEPGDLLLNPMDLYSGANCSISNVSGVISPAYMNLKSLPGYDPRFYDYYFKTQYWGMAMFAHGKGVSFDNRWTMNRETLMNYYIPYPVYSEQVKIADFLDKKVSEIDNVIEKTKQSIEEYKKLKQSIITEAVTKGLNPNVEMKDSGIEWIGKIPNNYKLLSLGQISKSLRNGYVGPTKDILTESGIRYIQSLHIKNGRIEYKDDFYVSEEWGRVHPKLYYGNLLVVQTGDIGQTAIVTKEFEGANCHALIIADLNLEEVYPDFVNYYFQSSSGHQELVKYQTGTTLKHLNSGSIKFSKVIVPPIEEQEEISKKLTERTARIENLILKKQCIITELEQYKKSLIYEYVTGKKEVPDGY